MYLICLPNQYALKWNFEKVKKSRKSYNVRVRVFHASYMLLVTRHHARPDEKQGPLGSFSFRKLQTEMWGIHQTWKKKQMSFVSSFNIALKWLKCFHKGDHLLDFLYLTLHHCSCKGLLFFSILRFEVKI
jgi:hypothetical protein